MESMLTAFEPLKAWSPKFALTEAVSEQVGHFAEKAMSKLRQRQVFACGVFCTPIHCPSAACSPLNQFSCHNFCDGSNVNMCASGCNGFCLHQGC